MLFGKGKVSGLTLIAFFVFMFALANLAEAQTVQFTTLTNFNSANGSQPLSGGLTLGNDGFFYGTTTSGGTNNDGTVFKVTTNGVLTSLVSFNITNGQGPLRKLILGNDGCFYGTTQLGGTNISFSYGTIFKMTTNGVLTQLFSFHGTDGQYPNELTLASDGNFYGTARGGGSGGYGTGFKITTNGALTTLTNFDSARQKPNGLTLLNDGNFYGTSYGVFGSIYGTFFKMATNGALTTLASFNSFNGAQPDSPLVLGLDGNLYGTTMFGGNNNLTALSGTTFKVTTNGTITTLVFFNITNGYNPGGLIIGNDGNFYGNTGNNDSTNAGTLYKLTASGTFTTLYSFGLAAANHSGIYTNSLGACPSRLAQGSDGSFYGTTYGGNTNGLGIVFKLTIIPPPPIPLKIQPLTGKVVLNWTNPVFNLQSAPEVTGTFTNIPNATSPYTNLTSGNRNFFRLIAN